MRSPTGIWTAGSLRLPTRLGARLARRWNNPYSWTRAHDGDFEL
ncbi:hypothetical protein ACH4PW_31455 [Streptomyces sp. NPDC017082]